MTLTPKQQFGLLAAVLRQPSLRDEPQVAKCLFYQKATFTEPRARWLAWEILTCETLEEIQSEAMKNGQAWLPEFLNVASKDPATYSLPACLVTTH